MAEPVRSLPPAPGPVVDPYVATWARIVRAILERRSVAAAAADPRIIRLDERRTNRR